MFQDEWTLNTFFCSQRTFLKKLTSFLNKKYPNLSSLLHLNVEKGEREWIFWLEENGTETKENRYRVLLGKSYFQHRAIANFFRLIQSSLFELTDTREEWDKDRWDVRILHKKYGIDYIKSQNRNWIDFSKIEIQNVREQVKKYTKHRLLSKSNFSWSTAVTYITQLSSFLTFIFSIEPTWRDLKALKRFHILQYLEWIHEYAQNNLKNKNAHPERYISYNLKAVQVILGDMQRYEYDIAPETYVKLLIFPEDIPKQKKKSIDQIDYIPDYVLEQNSSTRKLQ